jgi:hypothetical protein
MERKHTEKTTILNRQLRVNKQNQNTIISKNKHLMEKKQILAQLRTSSHRLKCETGRWKELKEEWDCRTCLLLRKNEVKIEIHFLLHRQPHQKGVSIRRNWSGCSILGFIG